MRLASASLFALASAWLVAQALASAGPELPDGGGGGGGGAEVDDLGLLAGLAAFGGWSFLLPDPDPDPALALALPPAPPRWLLPPAMVLVEGW